MGMNEACPLTLSFAFAVRLPALLNVHTWTHLLGIRTLPLLTSRLLHNQVYFSFSRSLIPPRCWKWVVNLSNHAIIKAEFNRTQPLKPFSHLIVWSLENKATQFSLNPALENAFDEHLAYSFSFFRPPRSVRLTFDFYFGESVASFQPQHTPLQAPKRILGYLMENWEGARALGEEASSLRGY